MNLKKSKIYALSEEKNPTKKIYTFRQKHSPGTVNCWLDYIFISNKPKKFCSDTDIIPAFKTAYSSALGTISNYNFFEPGPGLWKFNNSLIDDETFTNAFKKCIQNTINELNTNTSLDSQLNGSCLNMKSEDLQYPIVSNALKENLAGRK